MANIARSAKSGSDWTSYDLLAYNITVQPQSAVDFFGRPLTATLDNLDPLFVSGSVETEGLGDYTYRLLQYLDLASRANMGQASAIDDFAKEMLRVLGYEERGTLLRSRHAIPWEICGESTQSAQTDVCLVQGSSTILLLLQEDKTNISGQNPEAQVIAGAIATFQSNNRTRTHLGRPELDAMAIPCIVMIGTRPIFYKVPVTKQLSQAVITGQYPQQPTVVNNCVVASQSRRLSEGMETPNFRKLALQHFITFQHLAKGFWVCLDAIM